MQAALHVPGDQAGCRPSTGMRKYTVLHTTCTNSEKRKLLGNATEVTFSSTDVLRLRMSQQCVILYMYITIFVEVVVTSTIF
jgi:hypothetical protein